MPLGPKQTVLRTLAKVRLDDGQALMKEGSAQRRSGAIYLAGYGIECALKARICATRGDAHLDEEFFHHNLRLLARATDKWPEIEADRERAERLTYLETTWFVTMRYAGKTYDEADVRVFLARARDFAKWLLER